ncbi:efflux RND transporter periplasmic adaptor subunit [candidate division KSB1 bacterium]|nr:efflux RND transporter periplasmic adaptor subunit [candidate division KSB1 bacterium]MBL7094663.1 efflux RND transporter periplasmic adaptor subunit [candidate division KSB1 bacterium]
MSKKKKIIIGSVILLIIIVAVVSISKSKKGPDGITVQTEEVGKQKIVETVTATGRIQPKTQVKISADVAAKITHLNVKEGEWVENGKLLVQLDRERYLAASESAEANLKASQSNATLAKENMLKAEKDYARTKELFEKNLESQANLDQTYATDKAEKARYNSSLQQVEQAKAILKQAKDDLSKTSIYAPMSGTISKLNKEVGEIALGSQFQEDVIMIVSNLAGMEALVNVDENDVVSVAVGDSAKIEVDALPDKVFTGVVSEIASSATISGSGTTDQKTEFEVKISIIDPGEQLRPGMTASSDIITEIREDALGIPIQCVTVRTPDQLKTKSKKAEKDSVAADSTSENEYVADKDGFVPVVFLVEENKAQAKQVKTGIQSETHIEIVEGINEGDKIVTGSYRAISQSLKNNSQVNVKKEDDKK